MNGHSFYLFGIALTIAAGAGGCRRAAPPQQPTDDYVEPAPYVPAGQVAASQPPTQA